MDATWIGLSPRVRGNQSANRRRRVVMGSIPACAGEPPAPASPPERRPVYPRVCGGTPPQDDRCDVVEGLSPRVRGNHPIYNWVYEMCGSIPACAGEPGRRSITPPIRRVYPRVCGGTPSGGQQWRRQAGLSPRVRGNLDAMSIKMAPSGSIPACAGEPPVACIATRR